ncbi:MAG TPA: nitroreductase/quinone reductase family protein [Solirubrobacterales bacterium]|nr:nitroreductase/quinone reductase family protein [Solirubrobacterales bacterium]
MSTVPAVDPEALKGPLTSVLARAARLRPVTWFLVNVGNRVDPVLMRATGGRVKSTMVAPTVLLTHRGARSGKRRSTPLAYFTDGDDVVVIASRGGHEHNPAWLHNIRANPEVELWSAGRGGRYRAREAEGAERERLWQLATGFYPGFASYQERAGGRVIPVVVCSPEEAQP